MGQYYIVIILAEKGTTKNEYIRIYLDTSRYDSGSKLMEHSYLDNPLMKTMEILIGPKGPFYKSRVVWAGDYADPEQDSDQNLYSMVNYEYNESKEYSKYTVKGLTYSYIVNHTKKQYVEKPNKYGYNIHPLSLLTSEGNGRGGGDYKGNNENLCGVWARDVISMEDTIPDEYTELICDFRE
jgi:hypothetical protein